jgi:hypothetical protein
MMVNNEFERIGRNTKFIVLSELWKISVMVASVQPQFKQGTSQIQAIQLEPTSSVTASTVGAAM